MKKSILGSSIVHISILSVVLLVLVLLLGNPYSIFDTGIPGKWFIRWVFSVTAAILATMHYRNKYNNGFISYGKAFLIGFAVISIAYGVRAIVIGIDLSNSPELLELIQDELEQSVYEGDSDMSIEQEEMTLKMINSISSPFVLALLSALKGLFWAAFVSLITAAILKKEGELFDEEDSIDVVS